MFRSPLRKAFRKTFHTTLRKGFGKEKLSTRSSARVSGDLAKTQLVQYVKGLRKALRKALQKYIIYIKSFYIIHIYIYMNIHNIYNIVQNLFENPYF